MIPIRDVVVFPHSRVRFKVGRQRSTAALEIALRESRQVFVVTQRIAEEESPRRVDIHDVGTISTVESAELQGEQYVVVIKGSSRGTLVQIRNRRGAHFALVHPLAPTSDTGKPVTKLMRHVAKLIQEALPLFDDPKKNQLKAALNTDSPSFLSDSVAPLLPLISVEDKQSLLETPSPFDRLVRIAGLIEQKESEFQFKMGKGSAIFIGHGRSRLWARLQIFLENDLKLTTLNYETESRVGDSIIPILERMLGESGFAVLVLTAEDQTDSGKRARQNVIHEAGLFQGRLGFKKAILLVQDGIEDFSNVAGLQHIPFSGDHIEQTFYELQRVLKREGLIA